MPGSTTASTMSLFSCRCCAPDGVAGGGMGRPRGRVIDIHCHVAVPAAEAMMRPHFSPDKEPVMRWSNPASDEVNRRQFAAIAEQMTSVERRLSDMDRLGVDMQAISPSPTHYYYWAEPELALQASRIVNESIAAIAARHPDRFVAMGTVPLQAPDLAIEEMRRCVRDLGMSGIEISTNVAGAELARPELEPFFREAEALGVLLFLHPLGFTQGERLSAYYLNNLIGNPLESAIAVAHLIFSGVLARYPALKLCIAHGGGFLPTYFGRLDHAWRAREDCRRDLAEAPSAYLRRLYFDTVVFERSHLEHLVATFGARHILLGTDYPYDMAEPDPVGFLGGAKLSAADQALIAGGNAAHLLGLADGMQDFAPALPNH